MAFPMKVNAGVWKLDGYDSEDELCLPVPELLYIIKENTSLDDSFFKGLELEPIDVTAAIQEQATWNAYPNGLPSAYVQDCVPEELSSIYEEITSCDTKDLEAMSALKEKLASIKAGLYTFTFDVHGQMDDYYADNIKQSIKLTAKHAIGLLYGAAGYSYKELFKEFRVKELDEDFINEKADKMGFANDYIDEANGECPALDIYISKWLSFLDDVDESDDDDLTQLKVKEWSDYFNAPENFYPSY